MFDWSQLVVFVALFAARRIARERGAAGKSLPRVLKLPGNGRMDVGVLAIRTPPL